MKDFDIRAATEADVPIILSLIRELAEYEREPNAVVTNEAGLREVLFGPTPSAEVLLALAEGEAVGFAVYFFNFSTWLGRPGLYLEDLFVRPAARKHGIGSRQGIWARVTRTPGSHRPGARVRTNGVGGARLERSRHPVLQEARRGADDGVDGVSSHAGRHRPAGFGEFLLMILILLLIFQDGVASQKIRSTITSMSRTRS